LLKASFLLWQAFGCRRELLNPYPSDLTDAEWAILQPLIPGSGRLGRPPRCEKRAILKRHFLRGGARVCSWRHASSRSAALADWFTTAFMRWREDGLWIELHGALRDALRVKSGKKKPPGLRYSTRGVLGFLTTGEAAAMMEERKYWAANDMLWPTLLEWFWACSSPLQMSLIRQEPLNLLPEVLARFGWLRHLWADTAYREHERDEPTPGDASRGAGCAWRLCAARQTLEALPFSPNAGSLSALLPGLSTTGGWSRDYETREINSEAMILISASKLMLRRLAKQSS
jgi:transposase